MKRHVATILITGVLCSSLASCSPREPLPAPAPPPIVATDKIKLNPRAVERFGLKVVTVEQRPDTETLITTGEIKADENRVFHINSLSSGRVITDNELM